MNVLWLSLLCIGCFIAGMIACIGILYLIAMHKKYFNNGGKK